ncbi:MAG TPA: hypothetical protein VMB50_02515 [Myxococcales bacterium]|nr:hypothetical protein [Myxococcales bacterium]
MDLADEQEWAQVVEFEVSRLIGRTGEENAREIARLARRRSVVEMAKSTGVVRSIGIAQPAFDLLARVAPAPHGHYGELTARQLIEVLVSRYSEGPMAAEAR